LEKKGPGGGEKGTPPVRHEGDGIGCGRTDDLERGTAPASAGGKGKGEKSLNAGEF